MYENAYVFKMFILLIMWISLHDIWVLFPTKSQPLVLDEPA